MISSPGFLRLNTRAVTGMSPRAQSMDEAARMSLMEAIVAESQEVMRRYTGPHGLEFEIVSNIASARA